MQADLDSRWGVGVRAPSLFSLIIGWLTVDVDKTSNLVLVVRQTANLSHWYRGVGGDGQPVDHYKKAGPGFFTALVFVPLFIIFSYWSPYPWQQPHSSWAAPLMRLFLQNAPPPKKIALISLFANSEATMKRLRGLLWQSHRCRCDSACDTAAEILRSTRTVPAHQRATCSNAAAPANTERHTNTDE